MLTTIQQFDTALIRWANEWVLVKEWWDALTVFQVEFLGYWILAGLLAFGALAFLPRFSHLRRRNLEMVFAALAAGLIARFGVVELIRYFYDRARPFEVLPDLNLLVRHDGGGSFPSGHATFFFALAAVISRYYPKTSLLFWAAALSLSFSRVVAGLHWPSDIVAGAIVGIAVGFLAHWVFKTYLKPKAAA